MFSIELTLKSGTKNTFFISSNLTISEASATDQKEGTFAIVHDGHHNNGGWKVKEKYADVIKKIKVAAKLP